MKLLFTSESIGAIVWELQCWRGTGVGGVTGKRGGGLVGARADVTLHVICSMFFFCKTLRSMSFA